MIRTWLSSCYFNSLTWRIQLDSVKEGTTPLNVVQRTKQSVTEIGFTDGRARLHDYLYFAKSLVLIPCEEEAVFLLQPRILILKVEKTFGIFSFEALNCLELNWCGHVKRDIIMMLERKFKLRYSGMVNYNYNNPGSCVNCSFYHTKFSVAGTGRIFNFLKRYLISL